MVQLGLSWWQAWICVWVGYGIVAPFIVLNARPGAIFHITFPVVARTSFGIYGSLWCTFNRGAMAWCVSFLVWATRYLHILFHNSVWYGVQASIGGDCVKVMLRAMWPSVNDIRKPLRSYIFSTMFYAHETHTDLLPKRFCNALCHARNV